MTDKATFARVVRKAIYLGERALRESPGNGELRRVVADARVVLASLDGSAARRRLAWRLLAWVAAGLAVGWAVAWVVAGVF